MGRGQLTQQVQEVAKKVLMREITVLELRLMPYIQYVMVNNQKIDPLKISTSEREVLSAWRKIGYIEGGLSGLAITKNFWDAINEIIFVSYVEQSGDEL